jgi:hypothetical protein
MLINTIPCRIQINREQNIVSWLRYVQQQHSSTSLFCHTGIKDLQSWSGFNKNEALFRTNFVFENFSEYAFEFPGIEQIAVGDSGEIRFNDYDLQLMIFPKEFLQLVCSFNPDVIEKETVNQICQQLQHILGQLVWQLDSISTEAVVSDLIRLPTSTERDIIRMSTGTHALMEEVVAYSHFDRMAAIYPDRIALEWGGGYRNLSHPPKTSSFIVR